MEHEHIDRRSFLHGAGRSAVGGLAVVSVRRGVGSVLGGLGWVVSVKVGVSRFCRGSRMARRLAVSTVLRRWRCWPSWMPSWRRTPWSWVSSWRGRRRSARCGS